MYNDMTHFETISAIIYDAIESVIDPHGNLSIEYFRPYYDCGCDEWVVYVCALCDTRFDVETFRAITEDAAEGEFTKKLSALFEEELALTIDSQRDEH